MMGIWSIDAIQKMNKGSTADELNGKAALRLVRYHKNIEISPGIRYLVSRSDDLPDFGAAYSIPPLAIRGAERENGFIKLDLPRNFERIKAVEEELYSGVAAAFGRASSPLSGYVEDLDAPRFPSDGQEPECWAKIHVFRVGQGDTIVLELPARQIWIADARLGSERIRQDFQTWMCSRFGYDVVVNKVIATHMHYDHIQSIPYVIDSFKVLEVVAPDSLKHQTSSALRMLNSAGDLLRSGVTTYSQVFGQLKIKIIQTSSVESMQDDVSTSRDPNDHALAIIMKTPTSVAFLAADIRGCFFEDILSSSMLCDENGCLDCYKVSHHGSASGYDEFFFQAYNPQYAIISCGQNNKFGHPHRDVLRKLPSKYRLTWRDGLFSYPFFLK
jgi:competence protein ComEC